MIIILKKGSEAIEVDIDPLSLVESLQVLIKSKFRISPSLQKLSLQDDIVLSSKEPFSTYNITTKTTIYVESLMCKSFIRSHTMISPGITSSSFLVPSSPTNSALDELIKHIKDGNFQSVKDLINNHSSSQIISMNQEQLLDLLNATDEQKWTPVHYACYHKRLEILELLVKYECDINSVSLDHYTPLMLGIIQNSLLCVEMLLRCSTIQINKMTLRGSALHLACKNGFCKIVEKLLENGAHPGLEDNNGKTPILLTESIEILEMIPKFIGKELIDKYAKIKKESPLDFSGMVHWSSPWKINESQVFLLLYSSNGFLYHYWKRTDFENNTQPAISIKIKDIQDIRVFEETIVETKHFIAMRTKMECYYYYTKYADMTSAWAQRIMEAVNYFHVSEPISPINKPFPAQEETKEPEEGCSIEEMPSAISVESFQLIREVGNGSFGKVYEAIKKDTNDRYALKILCKSNLKRHKQLKYAIAECKILKEIHHPFIIPLHWAFQTHKNLYIVYDFCPYGDLTNILKSKTRLSESEAKFYIAETILAIEYLHSLNIVYRDLKPLNILVDTLGHVKLADFGLAKANVSKNNPAMSFCGSPAYLAPELIKQSGAHKPADIYTIGVTLYEFITGNLPFSTDNISRLYKEISSGRVKFPNRCSESVKNLIKSLMNNDPEKRPTIQQVKHHEFFEGVDWEGLMKTNLPSPFKPSKEFAGGFEEIKEEDLEEQTQVSSLFDITMLEES
ncbi:hypothetical protein SteCoe_246 [Stentor coeruleus]|uniref:Non-specific serine/threonine protein kinase n=1 Tax=Stentor coeruleus TaxID=5963 RepID=A0A1R2D4S7_9CILI|nr:hypothetical protein SteCoe_246 [Stentor coeruleus]